MIAHLRANAVAYLALFVALGGTSYAAIKLPANSVGTKQIRKNAVRAKHIKKGAVTPSKLSSSARNTLRGPAGATGARGLPGEAATKLFAYVQPVGSSDNVLNPPAVSRARGVTNVARESTGIYVVTFDRNVSQCAWSAVLAGTDAINPTTYPGPGEIGIGAASNLLPNQLRVFTYNSAGAGPTDLTPGGPTGFFVYSFC